MLVKMTTGLSGPAFSVGPGDERDFEQAEALRLIEAGYAVPVAARVIEVADKLSAPEVRTPVPMPTGRKPKGKRR